jgi:hypothetical protein
MDEEKAAAPTPAQLPPKPSPVIVHKSNNAPLVGAIVFLALVIGATAFYFATLKKDVSVVAIPTPTIAPQATASPTLVQPTIDPSTNLVTYIHPKLKDLAFSAYSISFSPDWDKNEEKTELTSLLTLSKDGNEIIILQGPMGGNQCVFEGEMPDGPANDYRDVDFVDIKAGEITLRRIVPEGSTTAYSFCSNSIGSKDTYGTPTLYGAISYKLASKNQAILTEMDKIISSLKSP